MEKAVFLTQDDYDTLVTTGTLTKGGKTVNYNPDDLYPVLEKKYMHSISVTGSGESYNPTTSFSVIDEKSSAYTFAEFTAKYVGLITAASVIGGEYQTYGVTARVYKAGANYYIEGTFINDNSGLFMDSRDYGSSATFTDSVRELPA